MYKELYINTILNIFKGNNNVVIHPQYIHLHYIYLQQIYPHRS